MDSERLLAYALTGEELDLDGPLPDALGPLGWDAARLQELRRSRRAAGEPWPFPVAAELVRGVGFARFDARLASLRKQLGLDGLVPAPSIRRPLNADERRLSAERPPHW